MAYYDPCDPYMVRCDKLTCSISPDACANASCDAASKTMFYEVTVPIRQAERIRKVDLQGLYTALETGAVRLDEYDKTALMQALKETIDHLGENGGLMYDRGKLLLIEFIK